MLPRGTFRCAICEDRYHVNRKNETFRSFFPERKIQVCDHCWQDYRRNPEYEHLRPDVDPEDKKKIEKIREYYGDVHIFF